jgi:hypothetical protein
MDTWSCETRNHVTHSALMHCAQRCAPVNSDEELFERMLPLEAWNLQSLISCRAWELLKGQIIWQICSRSEVEVWQKQMPRSLPLQSRGQEISFSKALKLVTCGSFRCWGTQEGAQELCHRESGRISQVPEQLVPLPPSAVQQCNTCFVLSDPFAWHKSKRQGLRAPWNAMNSKEIVCCHKTLKQLG